MQMELPREILILIFSFIPFGKDWKSVKLVCKKWFELSWRAFDHSVKHSLAIRYASESGHLEIVRELLKDKRVDPSADNNYAIRCATLKGCLEIVQELLKDSRVDPSAEGNSAIRWASQHGYLEIV